LELKAFGAQQLEETLFHRTTITKSIVTMLEYKPFLK